MARLENFARAAGMRGLGDGTAKVVNGFYGALGGFGRFLQDFLNGTWLGHTLHSVLVDVPMGAFSALVVLDLLALFLNVRGLATASTIVLGVGLLGAIGAIFAGLTDHKDTLQDDRPLVTLHGLIQMVATTLFAISFFMRLGAADSGVARSVAIVGYLVISVGAFIGGHVVYKLGYMINRNAHTRGGRAKDFTAVLPAAQLPEDTPTKAALGTVSLVLVRHGDVVYALKESCSHVGGPLSKGKLEGDAIVCPWHYSTFRLRDGAVIHGPAHTRQPVYEARIAGDQVEVQGPREA
ncbi:MAG: Rieske 2Fe-2S domain-containing protein [Candidatus Limnocylindria bacterium]